MIGLIATLALAATPPDSPVFTISSPPGEYLPGNDYVVTARVGPTGVFNWQFITTRRISIRLPVVPSATVGLRPQRVVLTDEAGGSQDVDVSMVAPCVTSDFACPGARNYAACSAPVPANEPSVNVVVSNVAVLDIGNGDFEVDVIPSFLAENHVLNIQVHFRVDPATVTSGTSATHLLGMCAPDLMTPNPWTILYELPDSITHTFADRVLTSLSLSAPSPIMRGQTSLVTVAGLDQQSKPMPPGAVTATLDERLGSAVGPALPPAEQGTFQQQSATTWLYTPGALPRAETIFGNVSATDGSLNASTTIQVVPGAIATLQLQPSSATINPGQSQDFNPRGLNAAGGQELVADTDVNYSLAPGNAGGVDANGVVSISGGMPASPTATLTATLKTNAAVSAQAAITIPRLPLTSCTLTLTPSTLGPADAARVAVSGSDNTASYDLTADSTLSWRPPNALARRDDAQGPTLVPTRMGPLAVIVSASNAACPGGVATASLTLRAAEASDIVALEFEGAQQLTLLVDSTRSVSVVGVRGDGSKRPLEPDTWLPGPGVTLADEPPRPAPGRQAAPGVRDLRVSEPGQTFVTVRYNALEATLPISVDERYLSFEWRLSKTTPRQGDLVTATLDAVADNARSAHMGVRIRVEPPGGLRVVGAAPEWTIDIPAGSSRRSFSIPLLAAARSGVWKLRASAFEADVTLVEGSESPQVRIVEDPEFAEALLIGRVFDDQNGDGRADENEPGIPGVTLGLTAGLFVTTDHNGNYHVPALRPGSVVVKIDKNTLPHIAPLTTPERMPIVLTPGQIFRADFGVNLAEPRAPELRRDPTRGVRIGLKQDGTREYVLPVVMEHGKGDTEKREAWHVRVPITGVRNESVIRASGDNGTVASYRVVVRRYTSGEAETYIADPPERIAVEYPPKPDSTHFLVALGEGIVGFEPRQGWPGGLYWDGKLAFAYRGRILGKYLIDAGADTTLREIPTFFQRDTRRIFRNLDPDAYYPVYGDSAQIIDERASGQKLYVRVEAGPVMARYGAFQTGVSQAQYGRYDRSLVGASARLLLDRPSGDAHKVIVFYAKPDTKRAHDEIYATGGSLYYLSRSNVVEGSEQIWLERRQLRTGLVRERRMLKPGADYQVDYIAGRILLERAPATMLPSESALRQNAAEGDEAWLLVDYETIGNLLATGQDDVIGGRVAERPIKGLEIGATGVTELRRDMGNYYLVGGDVSFSLWEPLKFRAEYAHSENSLLARGLSLDGGLSYVTLPDTGARRGDAFSARLSFEKWDMRAEAYGRLRTNGFNDTSNAQGERTSQAGFTLRSPPWHGFMAVLSLDDTRRDASYSVIPGVNFGGGLMGTGFSGVRLGRLSSELELSQAIGPVTLLASARYAQIAPGFGDGREAVVAGGVVWRIIPGLAIGAVHQQPVYREGQRLFDSLGRDTQLLTRFVIKQIEVEASGGYGERGPSGRGGVRIPIDKDMQLTSGLLFGGTMINESVSVGLRRRTGVGTFAFAENQFQRTPLGRLESHVGGLETRLGKRHVLSASFEAGKRNPGVALDAMIERYGAGVGYAFSTDTFQLRSRLEGRIESVGRLPVAGPADGVNPDPGSAQTSPQNNAQNLFLGTVPGGTRTIGGFVRADYKATETLWFAGWTRGNGSFATLDGSPVATFLEASVGFAYRPRWVLKPAILGRYSFVHERLPRDRNPQGAFTDAHIASLSFAFDPWKYLGFLGKIAARAGRLTIPDLGETSLLSLLAIPRVNVHITRIFDVSGEYRACVDRNIGTKHGALVEASALVAEFVRIGAGYNFSMIDDVGVDCQSQKALGFFVRAQAFY